MDLSAPALAGSPPDTAAQAAMRVRTARGADEIARTAQEFERMALAQMLALMETDVDGSDGLFGGGAGERAFKPFLMEEYAKGFADRGGIGIADAVRREMLKLQETGGA
jgi:Rod binding domain-containing protein